MWTLGSCCWQKWIPGFKFSLLDGPEVQAGVRRVRRHQLCLGLYFLRGPQLWQIYQGARPLTQGRAQHYNLLSGPQHVRLSLPRPVAEQQKLTS